MNEYEECKFFGEKGGTLKHILECSKNEEIVLDRIIMVQKMRSYVGIEGKWIELIEIKKIYIKYYINKSNYF